MLSQNSSAHALHNECARIRQELGGIQTAISDFSQKHLDLAADVRATKRLQHIIMGVFIAIPVALAIIWYFAESKLATMLEIAEERQVAERLGLSEDEIAKAKAAKDVADSK